MRSFPTIIAMLFIVSLGYCQQLSAITKEDASKIAKEYAQSLNPPINLSDVHEFSVFYVEKENIWIVWFVDNRSMSPPDSDFMIKIDSATGKPLDVLGGANKGKYRTYFEEKQSVHN